MANYRLRLTYAPVAASDPYPLYTSFDRNTIPWHTASGSWGAQVSIVAPTLPTTTRSVTVHNASSFNTEAAIDGTEITIGTGWSTTTNVQITADDIDVIIPPGIAIGGIEVNPFPWTTVYSRIRIRGETPGTHSGGRMGQLLCWALASVYTTDVVVDGIDMNGDSAFSGGEANIAFRGGAQRIAILNCRVISGGYCWLGGYSHIFIGNSNFFSGAMTTTDAGANEAVTFRNNKGPITIVDSEFQSTRYHPIRPFTNNDVDELLYMRDCVIRPMTEGKAIWMWNKLTTPAFGYGLGAIVDGCTFYAYTASTCSGNSQDLSMQGATYTRVQNCTFYSGGAGNNATYSQAYLDGQRSTAISVQNADSTLISLGRAPLPDDAHDCSVGNVFNSLVTTPSWGGPGDPTSVPLPGGLSVQYSGGTPTNAANCPIGP